MRNGFRRRTGDDFSDEVQAHLDLETDRLIAEGMSAADARIAAARAFGRVGLGLVTVAFTVFNAFVLRPFAIRDPDGLHQIVWHARDGGGQGFG